MNPKQKMKQLTIEIIKYGKAYYNYKYTKNI